LSLKIKYRRIPTSAASRRPSTFFLKSNPILQVQVQLQPGRIMQKERNMPAHLLFFCSFFDSPAWTTNYSTDRSALRDATATSAPTSRSTMPAVETTVTSALLASALLLYVARKRETVQPSDTRLYKRVRLLGRLKTRVHISS